MESAQTWDEWKAGAEELLPDLEPLKPWARAVFVRQRYELSQEFILSYQVLLKQQLPPGVTKDIPDGELLNRLRALSVSQRDNLNLDTRILAFTSIARFLIHYLGCQLHMGNHYPGFAPSKHDFIDFAAPLVGKSDAQKLVGKLSRIAIQPDAAPTRLHESCGLLLTSIRTWWI
ncbi:hypothetical protein JCM10296v2_004900 [Rhodotorula toruloides]